jgi:uncharacterized membrane protein
VSHWNAHPHVRTGTDLKFRERAADRLKFAFGTWTLLGLIIGGITAWMLWVHDPGELHLNLALSFLASVQGVILQIAANRGDRISSEVATGTHKMAEELLDLNQRQMQILTELRELRAAVAANTESEAR